MSHPLVEIHFEDVREEYPSIIKNWYHLPRVGEFVELHNPTLLGRVISVVWVDDGESHEYVVVRVK